MEPPVSKTTQSPRPEVRHISRQGILQAITHKNMETVVYDAVSGLLPRMYRHLHVLCYSPTLRALSRNKTKIKWQSWSQIRTTSFGLYSPVEATGSFITSSVHYSGIVRVARWHPEVYHSMNAAAVR